MSMKSIDDLRGALVQAGGFLDSLGVRLIEGYQALAPGRFRFSAVQPVHHRLAGSAAVVCGGLLAILLLTSAFHGIESAGRSLFGSEPAPPAVEYLLRCEKCRGQRHLTRAELDGVRSCNSAYWCECCRTFTAYRELIDDVYVNTPAVSGESP